MKIHAMILILGKQGWRKAYLNKISSFQKIQCIYLKHSHAEIIFHKGAKNCTLTLLKSTWMLGYTFLDGISLHKLLPLESLFPEILLSLADVSDLYLLKGAPVVLSCFLLPLDEPSFPSLRLVYGAYGTSLTILGFLFPSETVSWSAMINIPSSCFISFHAYSLQYLFFFFFSSRKQNILI